MTVLVVLVAVLLAGLVSWGAGTYNGLIGLRNRLRASWGDIDALLKRRADLIPNLVAAVRGYAGHEQRTFESVTAARTSALLAGGGPEDARVRAEAENVLTRRVHQLLALAEDYPDLRASANFLQLQADLTETEDDLASARRYYNAVVRDYNTRRETFPNLVIAGPLGFAPGEYFELADVAERAAPDVGAAEGSK
ncbi:MAG TPA: LemA family protein [Gemmatimonadota bacterium]|nr:LemA family protein [Gemmatimonadota bacterium]